MVFDISCVDTACSCKINSCIFERDANESAWWTGLLAWNLITNVFPFANEFTFPLSLSLSISLCSFSLSMSPATHYAGPCHEFEIPSMTAREQEKKFCYFKHPSHILYNKVAVVCRERGEHILDLLLILLLLLPIFPRTQTEGFYFLVVWLTLAHRQRGRRVNCFHWLSFQRFVGCEHPTSLKGPGFPTILIACDCSLPRCDQS